ncbi:hypothetical protein JHK84_032001 [Glycine max]|nr:hypothetical protein JHK85_032427 [Glycine max]KAG4995033.1 hypothetical protein JHK86_031860 [Glycine max]KAG5146458.1 hypothetical protein JHK84_032001 [Glycine max]
MVDEEHFIAQSNVKGKEKLKKLVDENKEKEMSLFMVQWLKTRKVQPEHNMTKADFNAVSSMIDQNRKDIAERMEILSVSEVELEASSSKAFQSIEDQESRSTLLFLAWKLKEEAIDMPHLSELIWPDTWPSKQVVQNVLGKFCSVPEWERGKKMVNQESFIADTIQKGGDQIKKIVKDNKEMEMTILIRMEMLNVNEAVVLRPPQQPEMQTPVEALPPVAPPEETATTLNYDHGASDVNADPLQS